MNDPRHPADPDQDLPLNSDLPIYDPRSPELELDPRAPDRPNEGPERNGPWLIEDPAPSDDLAFDPVTGEVPGRDRPLHDPSLSGPPRRSPVPWIVGLLAVVVLILLGWWFFFRPPAPEPSVEPAPLAEAPEPTAPALPEPVPEPEVPPIELPPLEDSDAVVARLVGEISSHPRLAAWLANDFLVRRFVATVVNLGQGESPRTHLPFTAPDGAFTARRQGGALKAEAHSYERYDTLTAVFTSLDPQGAARTYRQLSPLLREAYQDLGAEGSFDAALARAMGRVLAVPVPEGPPELVPKGLGYAYADPRYEGLSQAEKHLLRLGPDNLRRVQQHTRALAAALGIEPR